MWLKYFLYMYEYGTLKLEVILRIGVGEDGE
jgi:hypothetical protein